MAATRFLPLSAIARWSLDHAPRALSDAAAQRLAHCPSIGERVAASADAIFLWRRSLRTRPMNAASPRQARLVLPASSFLCARRSVASTAPVGRPGGGAFNGAAPTIADLIDSVEGLGLRPAIGRAIDRVVRKS
jgi:hypothetical protein